MSSVCTAAVPGHCPLTQVRLDWGDWWYVNFWQPLAVLAVLSLFFLLVLHPAYVEAYYRRGSCFQRLIKTYVGTSDSRKVPSPLGLVVLYTVQTLASTAAVVLWIWHSYTRRTTQTSRAVMVFLAHIELVGWTMSRLGGGCSVRCLWEPGALVDMVTIVPVITMAYLPGLLPVGFDCWLTLHFLRSYTALNSFERARSAGQLDEHTAGMAQVVMQLVLRVAALLTLMAGTIFTLEVLGDPPWIHDSFLETHAGDKVSFFQMVYWTVVTITTVGFGDFAPRTIISRTLTTVFIVIGVATIYFIQYSFSEMRRQHGEGSGRYWQRSWGRERHVVVILCHHGSASRMASLIHGFLQELLHASHNQLEDHHDHTSSAWAHLRLWLRGAPPRHVQTWPDVVFLSPTRWEEERHGLRSASFRDFLSAGEDFPSNMQRRVWFLVGQVTSETDLERARVRDSALTYVLSDLRSSSPEEDDGQTIYSALCIRDMFPEVRLRLMVMKPESKELAVQAGIEATRVFSAHELSACLLAQNVRCRGLIPAVTAMLKSEDKDDEEFFLRKQALRSSRGSRKAASGVAPPQDEERRSSKGSSSSTLQNCRNLDDIEKVLRKSQTKWCPEKAAYERRDPWMFEYFEGAEKTIFGFDLHMRYEGLSFGALAVAVHRTSGALLLGIQHRGSLILCPQGRRWRAKAGQICFAVAPSAGSLDPCRWNPEDRTSWRNRFQEARRKRRHKAHGEGQHVAAAQLMGWRLKKSLLQLDLEAAPSTRRSLARASAGRGEQRQTHKDGLLHADAARRPPSPLMRPLAPRLGTLLEDDNLSCTSEDSPRFSRRVSPLTVASLPTGTPALKPCGPWPSQEPSLSARSLREGLASGDELVVLIVCNGETWQQVRSFANTLRQNYLPCAQPLVVLAPTAPPSTLLEDFADLRVVCVQGSCLDAQALIEAGVLEASAVVALAGEPARRGRSSDYRVVLAAHELECWLGPSRKEVFTSFELHDSCSVRHLPRPHDRHFNDQAQPSLQALMTRQTSNSSIQVEPTDGGNWQHLQPEFPEEEHTEADTPSTATMGLEGRGLDLEDPPTASNPSDWAWEEMTEEDSDIDERLGSGIEDSGHSRRSFWKWLRLFGRQGAALERSRDSIMYHERFAAGQVFSPELWGMMLGRMFYMPAVIELIEALVMGDRREQQAYPWQVRVPPRYVGRPFEELVVDLAHGVLLSQREDETRFTAEDIKEPRGPPTVALALYRLNDDLATSYEPAAPMPSFSSGRSGIPHRLTAGDVTASATASSQILAEGTGGHHFVVSCPPHSMALRSGDWVVVLGGAIFGQRMHERGLLRGGTSPSARPIPLPTMAGL